MKHIKYYRNKNKKSIKQERDRYTRLTKFGVRRQRNSYSFLLYISACCHIFLMFPLNILQQTEAETQLRIQLFSIKSDIKETAKA